jgi:hypothetical protein
MREMLQPTPAAGSGAGSSRDAPKPNQQQMLEKRRTFQAGIQILDAAMQQGGQDQRQQQSTPQVGRQGAGRKVFGPTDIVEGGCPCAKGLKFPQWLTLNCGTDIGMAATQNSVLDNASAIPSILHAMKLQVLSMCKTHPVDEASIIRGVIDMEDLGTLRVAGHAPAGEQPGTAADTQWDT